MELSVDPESPRLHAVPSVSVGVPVYNGERFLERTLVALQEQDLADIEVIVSDNG